MSKFLGTLLEAIRKICWCFNRKLIMFVKNLLIKWNEIKNWVLHRFPKFDWVLNKFKKINLLLSFLNLLSPNLTKLPNTLKQLVDKRQIDSIKFITKFFWPTIWRGFHSEQGALENRYIVVYKCNGTVIHSIWKFSFILFLLKVTRKRSISMIVTTSVATTQ